MGGWSCLMISVHFFLVAGVCAVVGRAGGCGVVCSWDSLMAGAGVVDGGCGLSVSLSPRCHGCSRLSCGCRGCVVEVSWCQRRCVIVVGGLWGCGRVGWPDVWACGEGTWCVGGDDDVGLKEL